MNEFFGSEVKWGLAAASLPFLFLLLVFPPPLIAGLILLPAIGLFEWLSRELAASRDLEAEANRALIPQSSCPGWTGDRPGKLLKSSGFKRTSGPPAFLRALVSTNL